MKDDNVIDKLHFLAERCNDGAKGYSVAGNAVDDSELRVWLFEKSAQREKFATELNLMAVSLGGDAEKHTSFFGKLHREWLSFKTENFEDDIEDIIEECILGEEKAAADYRHILKKGLPKEAEILVRKQLTAINQARTELVQKEELYD